MSMNLEFSWLAGQPDWVQAIAGLAVLLLIAGLVQVVARVVVLPILARISAAAPLSLVRVVLAPRVLLRLTRMVSPLIVQMMVMTVPQLHQDVAVVLRNLAAAITVLYGALAVMAVLDAVLDEYERTMRGRARRMRSIKSYVQLGKLALAMIATIIIIAVLIDRSPLILLSGLGAMSAVLLLVFKDTLLSFTAGLQLSSNDLLRVGDWIEMPQLNADGAVIDIALHTVRVQNWDKTITTIPTWRLVSESFRNWRGMQESGGRRIKRTLRLDAGSVRFLGPDDIQRLRHIALLRPYLEAKLRDVDQTNQALSRTLGELATDPANRRRLTNLGTFRAYAMAFLERHPGVHAEMLSMVRTMEPTPDGIPVEVYCFTATTAWVEYEGIQGDIFDHLLAILPEFGLRTFQSPSGHDLHTGLRGPGTRPVVAAQDDA